MENFVTENLDWDRELGFGKLRYQLSRELQEKVEGEQEITEEERKKIEKIEAGGRQIFDGEIKSLTPGTKGSLTWKTIRG